jgi:hypothetical protein
MLFVGDHRSRTVLQPSLLKDFSKGSQQPDYKTAFDEGQEEVRRLDNSAARNLSFLSEVKVHEVDDGEDDEENHLSYRFKYSGEHMDVELQDEETHTYAGQGFRMANNPF